MRSDVAALYVDPRGPYPKLVEHWWDEARDARTYEGPWPVVAHPPCGPWANLRHLHTHPEQAELGPIAVEQVRKFGGVLEQPARSKLWGHCALPAVDGPWSPGEFAVSLEQVAWGHVARKPTWLYFVGIDLIPVMKGFLRADLMREPTHWVSGGRNCKTGGSVPPGIKVCSAQQRRRTPIAFAEWLISLAASATKETR